MPNERPTDRTGRYLASRARSIPPAACGIEADTFRFSEGKLLQTTRAMGLLTGAGIGVVLSGVVVLGLGFDIGPVHTLKCAVEAREGWVIEFDGRAQTLSEMKEHVRGQTTCVRVERAGWVNWNTVPEGHLVEAPTCCREWVSGTGAGAAELSYWVEGTAGQAIDPCRPPAPRTAPPAGCPGGPQLADP